MSGLCGFAFFPSLPPLRCGRLRVSLIALQHVALRMPSCSMTSYRSTWSISTSNSRLLVDDCEASLGEMVSNSRSNGLSWAWPSFVSWCSSSSLRVRLTCNSSSKSFARVTFSCRERCALRCLRRASLIRRTDALASSVSCVRRLATFFLLRWSISILSDSLFLSTLARKLFAASCTCSASFMISRRFTPTTGTGVVVGGWGWNLCSSLAKTSSSSPSSCLMW